MKRLLLLLATITLAGCVRPVDHPISATCEWIEDDSRQLDLSKYSDRRHLRFDAVTAEDVAIRWADQRFHLSPQWEPGQRACMQTLFQGVAEHHGVDVAVIRQYSRKRDLLVDVPVTIIFAVLFAFAAYMFARRINERFAPGEPGFWVMTLTMSIGVSLVGVLVGMLSSIVVEEFLMGSGHLSYRMNRIPWRQHWALMFVCGFVVFWVIALWTRRLSRHRPENRDQPDYDHKYSEG